MSIVESVFPAEILTTSVENRVQYFHDFTINHPHLMEAHKRLYGLINAQRQPVLIVYGPTGVGKTTLTRGIVSQFIKDNLGNDPGCIPIVKVEAVFSSRGKFEWKDYYIRTLTELKEPMIRHKVVYDSTPSGSQIIRPATSETDWRLVLENALHYRKTKVVMIDEAQHILTVASAKRVGRQFDIVKSLANITKTVFVLVGTYDLLPLDQLHGQLIRRGNHVHLRRYDARNPDDVETFKSIIWNFLRHLPIGKQQNLVDKYWDFFYERTIGCVGILKDWMEISLRDALDSGANSVSIDTFRKHGFSVSQVNALFDEACAGEIRASNLEDEGGLLDLQNKLGLDSTGIEESNSTTNRSNRRPGERNPERDSIGR